MRILRSRPARDRHGSSSGPAASGSRRLPLRKQSKHSAHASAKCLFALSGASCKFEAWTQLLGLRNIASRPARHRHVEHAAGSGAALMLPLAVGEPLMRDWQLLEPKRIKEMASIPSSAR